MIPKKDRPISERRRLAANDWVGKESAANLLEELKTTTLEQLKQKLINSEGDMPDSHAERRVKASPAWEEYIRHMCSARDEATKAKIIVTYFDMMYSEWQSGEANVRAEMKMSRS